MVKTIDIKITVLLADISSRIWLGLIPAEMNEVYVTPLPPPDFLIIVITFFFYIKIIFQ